MTVPDGQFDGLFGWDFDWWIAPFMDLMGPVFPALVALVVLTIVWIYSGTPMAIVMAILLGGAFLALLPPAAQHIGVLLIIGGIIAGLYRAYGGGGPRI